MEGAQPLHAFDIAANEITDAVLHFAGGLIGEGHGEDLPWHGAAGCQDMTDAGGEDTSFAGTCTSQHQKRTIDAFHRIPLFRVQAIQIRDGPHLLQLCSNALMIRLTV